MFRAKQTLIMGVLNCTPDSFSGDGLFNDNNAAIRQVRQMIKDGANIIDIGGESSRPGSVPVSEAEEFERVIPLVQKIREFSNIPISIDTTKPIIAKQALKAGANIINDISGFSDPNMQRIAAKYQCGVVVMHKQGESKNMQANPSYTEVVSDIKNFFREKIAELQAQGIQNIAIDPGIGFGKTLTHNWEILRRLEEFKDLKYPLLLGVSRKSFLAEITGINNAKERDEATLAVHMLTKKNANIWRVHNVKIHKKYLDKK